MRSRWIAVLAGVGIVTSTLLAMPAGATTQDDAIEVVVTLTTDGLTEPVLAAAGVDGGVEHTPRVVEVTATADEIAALRDDPAVAAVEPPVTYHAAALPNDPCVAGCGGLRTAYLEPLGIPEAWQVSTGAGAEIAVIDGGVEPTDPDLVGKVIEEVDYLGGAPGAIGHGTAVAALAVASANDGVGIAGSAPDAVVRSYKVLDSTGSASSGAVAAAVRAAADRGVSVINLSLTGPPSASVKAEIDRAVALGVSVVAAAGNKVDGVQEPDGGYPARYPNVIAVGASGRDDRSASFSYRGAWVDVFAPGTELAVPYAPGSGYARFDGTSGAAPIVAGAVALLRTARPQLTPAGAEAMVRSTSIPLGSGGTGEHRIQVGNLVRGLQLALPTDNSPTGSLDSVAAGPGSVSVSGWGLDPNTSASAQVHVYVGGSGTALVASRPRGDIGSLAPGYGAHHGFAAAISAATGTHRVCVYVIDVGPGENTVLGCRTVTVGGSPFGSRDVARQVPGGVQLTGWAIDPDVAGPISVHAYAGASGVAVTADRSRPDVGRAYPGWGPLHGYDVVVPTSASGPVDVCAYAINTGGGSNTTLRCSVLQLRQDPFGAVDSVQRVDSGVRIRGWALDPSVGSSVKVHVYVAGAGPVTADASGSRPDVAAAYPGYGSTHGYDVTVGAAPGARICVYAIDEGPGGNALVGCGMAP